MEAFSALLALCSGNSPVSGEFPSQRPVTRSFNVFFDLRLINDWINTRGAGDLRRHRAHYDVIVMHGCLNNNRTVSIEGSERGTRDTRHTGFMPNILPHEQDSSNWYSYQTFMNINIMFYIMKVQTWIGNCNEICYQVLMKHCIFRVYLMLS